MPCAANNASAALMICSRWSPWTLVLMARSPFLPLFRLRTPPDI